MQKDRLIIEVLKEVATQEDITIAEVEKVVDLTHKFIYNTITAIPFKEMTLEEFRNTKKNFILPSLCKLFAEEARFYNMNIKNKNNE